MGPNEVTFLDQALSFAGNDERLRLVIRYQTSVFANAGLVARRQYYTPRLFQVSFEKV